MKQANPQEAGQPLRGSGPVNEAQAVSLTAGTGQVEFALTELVASPVQLFLPMFEAPLQPVSCIYSCRFVSSQSLGLDHFTGSRISGQLPADHGVGFWLIADG